MLTSEHYHDPHTPYRNGLDTSPLAWFGDMAQLTPDQEPRAETHAMGKRMVRWATQNADICGFAVGGLVFLAVVMVAA
jgi:hypothetical protein